MSVPMTLSDLDKLDAMGQIFQADLNGRWGGAAALLIV